MKHTINNGKRPGQSARRKSDCKKHRKLLKKKKEDGLIRCEESNKFTEKMNENKVEWME